MALFNPENFQQGAAAEMLHPTDHCFFCGDLLIGGPWIYWFGCTGEIWLHPACSKRLADSLNLDWEKFKKAHPEKLAAL